MGFGGVSLWQLAIVLGIVILLFGTKKLRNIGGDLGSAVKGFKKAMSDGVLSDEDKNSKSIEEKKDAEFVETAAKVEVTDKTEKNVENKSQAMLDIGFAEILIVAVVALVVLGPEKLPMAIKTLGMWIGKAKRTISGIQSEISEELRLDELKRTTAVAKEQLEGELAEMKAPFVDSAAEKTAVKQPETTQLKDEAVPLEEQIVSLDKKSS